MSGEVLKKFGRYFLLDHIAQGGMAEIYRARLASIEVGSRLLVIKRIISTFDENSEFLQMFKSEIKVTMGFNHPNIVQVYDFGEENKQPYIAMEMVDGKNLKQFISKFSEIKQIFPVELATYIIEQAASGLHYAHSFKDKISGTPLDIIHRDISPQNILISYEGNVKVIDFGIAKATTNNESTRAGVIKGKPSYLSPEQISGETLDGRSDLFALGAVFWEILTGKKLFAGENDLAVLKMIESCQTYVKPPSTLNPNIPKELDYIVLKLLTKQRNKRYQNAEELQRALHKFLYSFMPEFNPSDLSYYAKDLFKNDILEDRKKIQKLNEKVEQLLALESTTPVLEKRGHQELELDENTATMVTTQKGILPQNVQKIEIENSSSFQPNFSQHSHQASPQKLHSRQQGSLNYSNGNIQTSAPKKIVDHSSSSSNSFSFVKTIFFSLIFFCLVLTFGPDYGIKIPFFSDLLTSFMNKNETQIALQGIETNAIVLINGKQVANKIPTLLHNLPIGSPIQISISSQHGSFQKVVTLSKNEQKEISVEWIASQASSENGSTSLSSVSSGAPLRSILLRVKLTPGGGSPKMTLNGVPFSLENPTQAPLDSPLEITVDRKGYKPFKREFFLESSQVAGLSEWLVEIPLEPKQFGFLSLHSVPSSTAMIYIDDTPWIKKTPIENEKLPPGTYKIVLKNDVLGMEKEIQVVIEEGKTIKLSERLEIKN